MPEVEYRKAVLSNGMTLVAERSRHGRAVSLGLWVKAGSRLESDAETGISHFIEHMVFKGTARRSPLEIATALEAHGGDLNAFTDRELTCYHATVLQEDVEKAMDVISDLVLHPAFPEEQLEKERKVLLQELSQIEDTPDDWIQDVFFETVWKGSPLGRPIIGNRKTIRTLPRAALLRFFRTYYRPDNFVLSVAGDVDFDALVAMAERYFTVDAKLPPLKTAARAKPVKFHPAKRRLAAKAEQVHVLVGFEGIGFRDPDRFVGLVLSFFLGGGMSSRLFQEIRERAGLAYAVDCDFIPFSDAGVFTIYSAMAPRSLPKCFEILGREIQRLKQTPLSDAELEMVKGHLRGTILLSADQVDVRQESLGRNEIVFGRYVTVDEVLTEIGKVSAERVMALANRIFVPEKEAVVTLGRLPSGYRSRPLLDS